MPRHRTLGTRAARRLRVSRYKDGNRETAGAVTAATPGLCTRVQTLLCLSQRKTQRSMATNTHLFNHTPEQPRTRACALPSPLSCKSGKCHHFQL